MPSRPTPERVRKRRYLVLMGICLTLIVLSWVVLPHFSVPAAVALSLIAMVIPPVAAIVANWNTGFGPHETYSGEPELPQRPKPAPPPATLPSSTPGMRLAAPPPPLVPPRPRGSGEDRADGRPHP